MNGYQDILIVEDDETLRSLIARNLEARGCRVREAVTATEAMEAVLEESPGLILLDIGLPDRSGWDVLRELRTRGMSIPTAVISAVRVSRERLDEFGPIAYLPKPFPLEALLRLVETGGTEEDISGIIAARETAPERPESDGHDTF
jgi:DNA-binding response OmpR family regulator